jgi:hypothetical protein
MLRWLLFFITVALGLAAGLYYGWVINPVEYVNTTPDSLRADYKADYVLMVAESYNANGDLNLASQRLALLGDTPPVEVVDNAILFAVKNNYNQADVTLMQRLADTIRTMNPALEGLQP